LDEIFFQEGFLAASIASALDRFDASLNQLSNHTIVGQQRKISKIGNLTIPFTLAADGPLTIKTLQYYKIETPASFI